MFISEDQLATRINSDNNIANLISRVRGAEQEQTKVPEVIERTIDRPTRDTPNLTVEARTEIAARARLGERQQDLADEFHTHKANISHIKNGRTKGVDEEKAEEVIAQVRDKALDRLMTTLGLLTDDKLSGCSAKDLSVIASNMGRVVEKTLPKSETPDQINLIIYSPELRKEHNFPTVEV